MVNPIKYLRNLIREEFTVGGHPINPNLNQIIDLLTKLKDEPIYMGTDDWNLLKHIMSDSNKYDSIAINEIKKMTTISTDKWWAEAIILKCEKMDKESIKEFLKKLLPELKTNRIAFLLSYFLHEYSMRPHVGHVYAKAIKCLFDVQPETIKQFKREVFNAFNQDTYMMFNAIISRVSTE